MSRYVFLQAARADIAAIIAYYKKEADAKVVRRFVDQLKIDLDIVAERPRSFAIIRGDKRRANMRRFPFNILFRIMDGHVLIIAVRHHRRHPGFGTRRR